MLFSIFHQLYIFTGVSANGLALWTIFRRTPTSLKDYSIIIVNTALNDITAVVLHFLLNARLFINGTVVANMANGPCRIISDLFCSTLFEIIHTTIMHTCFMIGLSFWYRKRALKSNGDIGWWKLQTAMFIAITLHIPNFIAYMYVVVPREFMEPFIIEVYGTGHSDEYSVYGFLDVSDGPSMSVIGYFLFFPIIVYTYIFFTRRTVNNILAAHSNMMSTTTRETHKSLVKLLSIHAVLPTFVTFAFAIMFLQMTNYYHSVEIERMIYAIAIFPTLVNPMLTLYYIRPYRIYVSSILHRMGKVTSIGSVHGEFWSKSTMPKTLQEGNGHSKQFTMTST